MRVTIASGIAFALWACTFLLLIPAAVHLPFVMTFVGFALIMFAPMSWLNRRELYVVAENSYLIGLGILLVSSGLVVLATGRSKRATRTVAIVDSFVIALSIVVGVFVATTQLPAR